LDHPFAGRYRVESEPFMRLLQHIDQVALQTSERGF
jgi:hypothetical protein